MMYALRPPHRAPRVAAHPAIGAVVRVSGSARGLRHAAYPLGVVPTQRYAYDDRDRLTSWTLGGTTQSYGSDRIGNLVSKAGVSQTYGANANGTGAGPHQARSVGGVASSYDLNGTLLSGGGRT